MDEAIRGAVAVPMDVMRRADQCWQPMLRLADCCNFNCRSDLQVRCSLFYWKSRRKCELESQVTECGVPAKFPGKFLIEQLMLFAFRK